MLKFHIFVVFSSITKKGEIERYLFGFGNWLATLGGLIMWHMEIHRWLVHRWSREGAHCIWGMTWSHVTKLEKIKTRLAWWTSWNGKGQVKALKRRTARRWSLGKTWHRWTESMVKSEQGQDRWTKEVMWWYGVDHIIHDCVGALVASTIGGWK